MDSQLSVDPRFRFTQPFPRRKRYDRHCTHRRHERHPSQCRRARRPQDADHRHRPPLPARSGGGDAHRHLQRQRAAHPRWPRGQRQMAELCDALDADLSAHARFILRDQLAAFAQAEERIGRYDAFIRVVISLQRSVLLDMARSSIPDASSVALHEVPS